MKITNWVLALLLVAGLIGVAGCVEFYPSEKTTGGGWFTDNLTGHKITFGFNAQPTDNGEAKGKFQLVDSADKTRIHGTFSITHNVTDNETVALFQGTCSINGSGEYDLYFAFWDLGEPGVAAGDNITVAVNATQLIIYSGFLERGNIKIHPEK